MGGSCCQQKVLVEEVEESEEEGYHFDPNKKPTKPAISSHDQKRKQL